MKAIFYLIGLLATPVIITVLAAKVLRIKREGTVFWTELLLLPIVCLMAGAVLLLIFFNSVNNMPPGQPGGGGDGPAFFVIIGITFILPLILLVPGFISGTLAVEAYRYMLKFNKDTGSN